MKKIIVMLFLVLTVSIAIGKRAYAEKIIRKGHILIYNETPFSNKTVLSSFYRFWNSKTFIKWKRETELRKYWVTKAGFKVMTQYAGTITYSSVPLTGCFAFAKVISYLKASGQTTGNYISYLPIKNSNGKIRYSCDHRFLKTKKAIYKYLKPLVEKMDW